MAPNPRIIGDITAKLTVKNLPNIKGDPNYEATKKMIQLLYSNMKTPPMPQGGGHNDHIILITKPTIYTTLSNTACEDPPPPTPGCIPRSHQTLLWIIDKRYSNITRKEV